MGRAQKKRRALLAAALALAVVQGGAAAQPVPAPGTITVGAEIGALGQAAAVIFVGQIVSIERGAGCVEIRFRVEQNVRGALAAGYVLREWPGLWAPGQSRYMVGQRVLAFLHAPAGGGGLSSPVHGAEGLVPVVVQGRQAPELLDIRRVAAAVVRSPETPLPTQVDGAITLKDALSAVAQADAVPAEPLRLPLPIRGTPPTGLMHRVEAGQAAPLPVTGPEKPLLHAPLIGGGNHGAK